MIKSHLNKIIFNCLLISRHNLSNKSSINIFNRNAKRVQKDRAILSHDSHLYDYIKDEIAYRVADRVYDIKRHFPIAADIGCQKGYIASHLTNDIIDTLFCCDTSLQCLMNPKPSNGINIERLNINEENVPFRDDSIDLVISSLSYHWVNDLPSAFNHVFRCLKKDGVFIASMFGGQTLYELRCSLQLAETERENGFAPHISPFVEPQDIAALLNRSGFSLTTIDSDEIKVNYPTMFELLYDIKGMAENSVLWNGKGYLHRDTLLASAAIYKTLYGNSDGTVPATFHIFYLIGWKPHESQQKPAERGSGTFSLKDIADLEKILKKDNTK